MNIKEMRSRIDHTLDLSRKILARYGSDEVNNIGISHSHDIDAFFTSLMMAMGNSERFMDGLAVFFVYAYMVGQDSMAVQQSDEFKAAKERLGNFLDTDGINEYVSDQLIADIRIVLEALK